MKPNPVGWFEIYVEDMARARAFYEIVFEVTLEALPGTGFEMWAFPLETERYGSPGALIKMEGCPPGIGGTLVYFSCEDCAAESARAETAGGRIFKEKFSIGPYGFIALVQDCEGNLIGLHSRA